MNILSSVPAEHTYLIISFNGGDSGSGSRSKGNNQIRVRSAAFTLIELLVVISIIALMSSVVIAALNVARTRGADGAAKAGLKQMHAQAQNYLDTTGAAVFGTAANCTLGLFADARFTVMLSNLQTNAGSAPVCASLGANWAVSVPSLKGGGSWCTDNSQGWFRPGTAQASGVCL